jgi:hypothetical protein
VLCGKGWAIFVPVETNEGNESNATNAIQHSI